MSMQRVIIALLSVWCVIAVKVSADAADDWRPIHYTVYAQSGQALPVEKTRALLEQLRDLYQRTDADELSGLDKETFAGRVRRVRTLLLVGEMDQGVDCDRGYFEWLNRLIKRHFMFTTNVIPYLQYYRWQKYETCRTEFRRMVAGASSGLSADTLRQVETLFNYGLRAKESIEGANEKPYVCRACASRAILDYISALTGAGIPTLVENGPEQYAHTARARVGDLCKLFRQTMTPYLMMYKGFDPHLARRVDSSTLSLIAHERFCRDIVYELDFFISDSFARAVEMAQSAEEAPAEEGVGDAAMGFAGGLVGEAAIGYLTDEATNWLSGDSAAEEEPEEEAEEDSGDDY